MFVRHRLIALLYKRKTPSIVANDGVFLNKNFMNGSYRGPRDPPPPDELPPLLDGAELPPPRDPPSLDGAE